MRKLAEKRKNPENRLERRDIIAEYADFGTKMPQKVRDGSRNDAAGNILPRSETLFQGVGKNMTITMDLLGKQHLFFLDLDVALADFQDTIPVKDAMEAEHKAPPPSVSRKVFHSNASLFDY